MLYVIVRDDGAYVAPPGQEKSYTRKLENARTFTTLTAAERECCPENERAVPVEELLNGDLR